MKLKINAVDKIIMSQLMPQTESILIQTMARDIGRKIEVTEKDRKAINLRPSTQGPGVVWNPEKVAETEIELEFSEAEIRMLQEQVKKLDESKKISVAMLDTCIKIQDVKIKQKVKQGDTTDG